MRFKYYLRGAGIGVIAATLILSIAFLFQNRISDEEVMRRATKLGMVMDDGPSGTLADMQQPGTSSVDLENSTDDTPGSTGSGNGDGTGDSGDGSGSQGSSDDPVDKNPADSDPAQNDDARPGQDSDADKNPDEEADSSSGQNTDKKDQDIGTDKDSDKETDKNSDKDLDKETDKNTDKDSDKKPDKDSGGSGTKKDPDNNSSNGSQTSNKAIITIESGDVSRIVSAKVFEAGLVDSADEFNSYLGEHGYANLLQPGTYEITKGATFRQIAVILTTRR